MHSVQNRRDFHSCGGDDTSFQVLADSSGEVPWTDRYGYALSSEIRRSDHEPGKQGHLSSVLRFSRRSVISLQT